MTNINEILVKEFNRKNQDMDNLIKLHEEGNTVPFIARYRKEMTGAMDETVIRDVIERYEYLVSLQKRKDDIIKNIDEKGKLTDTLKKTIINAKTLTELDDIYAPYKSKRKTKADVAKEAGVEPLAIYIKSTADLSYIDDEATKYINDVVIDIKTAIDMARDILTEDISHTITVKNRLRELYFETAVISSKKHSDTKEERSSYENYYEFDQKVAIIPPHRILAIFRGEKENALKVKIEIDDELAINAISAILYNTTYVQNEHVERAISRAYKSFLSPSIELELRSELKSNAELRAINVFSENLAALLLTPTIKGRRILGIDPAFRTGCKYAAIDDTGKLLSYGVIYPTQPVSNYEGSRDVIVSTVKKYNLNTIAIGNGTASRETEEFVAKVISEESLAIDYTIVNEAGASVYSASEIAKAEFPDIDLTFRGAVSIARRVIDPLSELVKIEPKSIGVGMYQHDVSAKKLDKSLKTVVETVVNSVGVNLNTASVSLLKYIAGLNANIAENIIKFREKKGRFTKRSELLDIPGLGESIYRQCAGFLKIYDGEEKLDKIFIHPESYEATYKLLNRLGIDIDNANMIRLKLKDVKKEEILNELGIGAFTFDDIIANLEKPDRDIRDNVDPIIFKNGIISLEDIEIGSRLNGKITNIVDFGAFVDVGLKNDGLIHLSQLADKFIKSPSEVVKVGDNVKVRVLEIDKNRGRVSLTMKSQTTD